MTNNKPDKDYYHTLFHEKMKYSMKYPARPIDPAKPAGDFKPYNRRQPSPCFELSHVIAVLVLVGLAVLGLWVGLGR